MGKIRRLATIATGVVAGVAMTAAPASAALPEGMTASYVVVDQETGTIFGADEHKQYRSASLVKLFIALDYLESHGPDYEIPADDLALLEPMLRSSNDDAASTLWVRDGWDEIVKRMVVKIGLTDTAPPASRGKWGYTAISAADIARTYQYIQHEANPKYRDFIMSNLEQSTKCGSDGFDQSFGLPSAIPGPKAVKQGWSGYGAAPAPGEECKEPDTRVLRSPEVKAATAIASSGEGPAGTQDIDVTSRAMHTSGTVSGKIVVVLTLEPTTLSWQESADRITTLTRDVYLRSAL
ncbi:hypothetical protein SAMN04489727_2079 [Amycolatopsis tolypomycina]|uniref:Beta-lactamase enzyme family protein n=2 Tax=Amycolatopsis tolypomycina TaxID=208445 RepID=A0A1H4JNZ2_9PSEU|nr:hypothetical protein SAMN04489727_2079 [Amycolatopsis tolypomycina]